MSAWKTLSSKLAYENFWIRVREDTAINPVGKETVYGCIETTADSVCVVPIDEDGFTYIVRQYRYPLQQESWEFVAGRIDDETPETAARREIEEETGIGVENLTYLGNVYLAPGVSSFMSHVYLARQLKVNYVNPEPSDGILEVKRVSTDTLHGMIGDGTVKCSPTITAFHMAMTYLKKERND